MSRSRHMLVASTLTSVEFAHQRGLDAHQTGSPVPIGLRGSVLEVGFGCPESVSVFVTAVSFGLSVASPVVSVSVLPVVCSVTSERESVEVSAALSCLVAILFGVSFYWVFFEDSRDLLGKSVDNMSVGRQVASLDFLSPPPECKICPLCIEESSRQKAGLVLVAARSMED